VHPATLLGQRSVFFTQCEPEAKRAITNRQFWKGLSNGSFTEAAAIDAMNWGSGLLGITVY